MRDLTEDELKLAPDWAVKFDFFHGNLVFMSNAIEIEGKNLSYRFFDVRHNKDSLGTEANYNLCTRLISEKPFDITKHEFSDSRLSASEASSDSLLLSAKYYQFSPIHGYTPEYLALRVFKDDTIAIAKALGVTGEDLK